MFGMHVNDSSNWDPADFIFIHCWFQLPCTVCLQPALSPNLVKMRRPRLQLLQWHQARQLQQALDLARGAGLGSQLQLHCEDSLGTKRKVLLRVVTSIRKHELTQLFFTVSCATQFKIITVSCATQFKISTLTLIPNK